MGLTEPYSPEPGHRVHCRGKSNGARRYSGEVLAVFEQPVVLIRTSDGRLDVVVVREDFEWLQAKD